MQVSSLQSSIANLFTLQGAVQEYTNLLIEESSNKDNFVYPALSSQIMLMSVSYLEEWRVFISHGKDDNRVQKVGKLAKPVIKVIKGWKDLVKVRNTFIAHNFREKKTGENKLLYPDPSYDIPSGKYDHKLLSGCIFLLQKVLNTELINEIKLMAPVLESIQRPVVQDRIKSEEELKNRLVSIAKEVEELQSRLS